MIKKIIISLIILAIAVFGIIAGIKTMVQEKVDQTCTKVTNSAKNAKGQTFADFIGHKILEGKIKDQKILQDLQEFLTADLAGSAQQYIEQTGERLSQDPEWDSSDNVFPFLSQSERWNKVMATKIDLDGRINEDIMKVSFSFFITLRIHEVAFDSGRPLNQEEEETNEILLRIAENSIENIKM